MMMMKKLLSGLILALGLLAEPAAGQNYQVPAHSTPIGRGPGVTSFNSAGPGTAGQLFIGQGASADPQWKSASGACTVTSAGVFTCTGSGGGLTVGTTTIASGTNTSIEFNNAGILGEYAISGSGNVCMTNSCSMVTPALGTPSALVLTNATGLPVAGINGLGTGVGSALGVNVGSAGAFVTLNGALGTPSSGVGTNLTGTASALTSGHVTTNANLTGDVTSVGNATTAVALNGTNLAGLATGLLVNTTGTGVPTIKAAPAGLVVGTSDTQTLTNKNLTGVGNTFPTFNQNTTGSAASFTGSLVGDVTGTQGATVVGKINGVSLAGLATGILKNTTTAGTPSIAVNSDLPVMSATVGGAVPTPPNNTTTFLRGDGTFATPSGSGNVSAGGTLTSNAIITGAGTTAVQALGSLGTTTTVLHGNAAGAPSFGAVALGADVSGNLPVTNLNSGTLASIATYWRGDGTWATPAGAGTVTSVSVVPANGLAGTVATSTTTPAITLSTSVTGVVKGDGTSLSAATAGTDYVAPGGALGTPSSGVATNLTGTAAGLTAGAANAINSATTTVNVNSATAPSANQVLTATSSTAATWQTPTGGGSVLLATMTPSGSPATITSANFVSTPYTSLNIVIEALVSTGTGNVTVNISSDNASTFDTAISGVLVAAPSTQSGVFSILRVGITATKIVGLSPRAGGGLWTVKTSPTTNIRMTAPTAFTGGNVYIYGVP